MSNDFKLGDKVVVDLKVSHLKLPLPLCTETGIKRGTVCYLDNVGQHLIGVDLGKGFPGHNCMGAINTFSGWLFDLDEVKHDTI